MSKLSVFLLAVLSLVIRFSKSSQHLVLKRQVFPNVPLNLNCGLDTCRNGGICFGYSVNVSYCVCLNGFSGPRCESLPSTTTTTTTTLATTTTTTTVAPTRPIGALIVPDGPICKPGICQNGGQCYVIGGHLGMCFCKAGFNGPNCQYRSTTTATMTSPTTAVTIRPTQKPIRKKTIACPSHLTSLCMNGSTCVYSLDPNVLRCICTREYTGYFCNIPTSG